MSIVLRRLVACLLIAFVPLQVTAASRLALCADIGAAKFLQAKSTAVVHEPCGQMASMPAQDMTDIASASHLQEGCWLGSICLAGLTMPPMPSAHASINLERHSQAYRAYVNFFHSIVSDNPLRPPASV